MTTPIHPQPEPASFERRIDSRRRWELIDLRELWRYRDLLWVLAMRDVKVRYKQTVLGAAWAVLQPTLKMVIFTVIFHVLAKIESPNDIPYPVFAFVGLLPWQLFAYALTQSSSSLVNNQQLVTKIYFPRLILPLASVGAGVLDLLIGFGMLILLMIYFGVPASWGLLTLPIWVILVVLAALAVGIWFSALAALYRDIRYMLLFITEIWFFLTPVVYPSSLAPEAWRPWLGLNPMAGIIEGFRWAVLGQADWPGSLFLVSLASTFVLLVTGLIYFRRMERIVADWI